jgi:hypothetical protein
MLSLYIYPERQIPQLSAGFEVPVKLASAVGFAAAVELSLAVEFALTSMY